MWLVALGVALAVVSLLQGYYTLRSLPTHAWRSLRWSTVDREAIESPLHGLACRVYNGSAHCSDAGGVASWHHVRAACRKDVVGLAGARTLIISASTWALLRIRGVEALLGASSTSGHAVVSSTFPITSTTLPWGALEWARDPVALSENLLMVTPSWLFQRRMLVRLNAREVCQLADSIDAMRSSSAEQELALAAATRLLEGVGDVVEAVGGDVALEASQLWTRVLATAARQPDAIVRIPNDVLQWCINGHDAWLRGTIRGAIELFSDLSSRPPEHFSAAGPTGSHIPLGGGQPSSEIAHSLTCDLLWLQPRAISNALRDVLQIASESPPRMRLHDFAALVRAVSRPAAADAFPPASDLYTGILTRNASRVHRSFNPDVQSLGGSYLTAFNIIVTRMGSLQNIAGAFAPQHDAPPVKERYEEYDLPLSRRKGHAEGPAQRRIARIAAMHAARTDPGAAHTVSLLAKDTCEGLQRDWLPSLNRALAAPLYDEVVVITHRFGWNFYHWVVESLGRLVPILDYLLAHPRVMVHLQSSVRGSRVKHDLPAYMIHTSDDAEPAFRREQLELLGISWNRVVMGPIRARIAHVSDNYACGYPFALSSVLLRERLREALGVPLLASGVGNVLSASAAHSQGQLAHGKRADAHLTKSSATASGPVTETGEAFDDGTTAPFASEEPGDDDQEQKPSHETAISKSPFARRHSHNVRVDIRRDSGTRGVRRGLLVEPGAIQLDNSHGRSGLAGERQATGRHMLALTAAHGGRRRRRHDVRTNSSGALSITRSTHFAAGDSSSNSAFLPWMAREPPKRSIVVFSRNRYRRMTNNGALIVALRKLPHVTVTEVHDKSMPNTTTVLRLVADADVIVGAHGAGLTHALLLRP